MNEQLVNRAQALHAESALVEERISFVDKQVQELSEFLEHLSFLEMSKSDELFASLGKGIFLDARLHSKDLFVDAGAGVLVKKSLAEVKKIIRSQLENLSRMRTESQSQLVQIHAQFEEIVTRIEQFKNAKKTI